jgi:hypothetical protein
MSQGSLRRHINRCAINGSFASINGTTEMRALALQLQSTRPSGQKK